jgi:hypothetical protein
VVYGFHRLDHAMFGWPLFHLDNRLASAADVLAAPMTAKAMITGGGFIATLAGGLIAVRISGWEQAGWIVAGLIAATGLAITLIFPHPLWMQIASVVTPLLAGAVVKGAAGAA